MNCLCDGAGQMDRASWWNSLGLSHFMHVLDTAVVRFFFANLHETVQSSEHFDQTVLHDLICFASL